MSYDKVENAQHDFEQSSTSIWLMAIGVITIIIGGIGFCVELLKAIQEGFNILLIVPLIGVPLTGLLFIAAALDAVQETAENTRAMRKIMRD